MQMHTSMNPNLTVKQLRSIAKAFNIRGAYKLRKSELIRMIEDDFNVPRPSKAVTNKKVENDLKKNKIYNNIAMRSALRNGNHRKNDTKNSFTKNNDVKVAKSSKSPRTLSKGLQMYNQILRTVRGLFPYDYRNAQKLSSELYRSGVDSESEIAIMIMEREISRLKNNMKMEEVAEIIKEWENRVIKTEIKNYKIHKVHEAFNRKYRTWFDEYKVELDKNGIDIDPITVFMDILNIVKKERDLVDGDKIRLIVSHDLWAKPNSSGLLNVNDGLEKMMASKLGQFAEYKSVSLDEVKIHVQSYKIPRGKSRLHIAKNTISRKKCVISIKNDDSTCLARAIVTAYANINKHKWTSAELQAFRKSRKLQKVEALKLHEEADVEVNDFGNTLEDVKKFANHLGIQINIVNGDQFNEIIYSTDEAGDHMIYLYKNKNHFDVITSMPGFLCKSYYCHTCKKPYKKRDCHKCPSKCIACFKYFSNGIKCSGDEIKCSDCNRSFFGQNCFEEHKRNRSSGKADIVCRKVGKCLSCERTITIDLKDHICGYSKCTNCDEYCDMNIHKCYMTRLKCKGGNCTNCTNCSEKKKCYSCRTKTEKYMFYDFECMQETGVHTVNLAVLHDFDGKEWVFKTIDEFCNFVFTIQHKGYTFIAHNSKGYDCQFILKWCVENGQKPYCIYTGSKIMSMEIHNLKISLNFVASSLATFPKTFGLSELKKGYFPHYFNKE